MLEVVHTGSGRLVGLVVGGGANRVLLKIGAGFYFSTGP